MTAEQGTAAHTRVTRQQWSNRVSEAVDIIRRQHEDNGEGRCRQGCGGYPCEVRQWLDRTTDALAARRIRRSLARQTSVQVEGSVSVMAPRDWRPRYLQLAEQIREQIERGELVPGTAMPSETDLAESSGLSRTSVRQAIRQLREWGLVRAEQGRGTFVRAPRQRVRRNHTERYQWEKDRVHASEQERRVTGATERDTGLTVEDLEFHADYRTTEADDDLAGVFGVPVGTRLLERRYWNGARKEKVPLLISHSYLVYDMVSANRKLLDVRNEPWPGGTLHQLSTVGIEVDRIVDEITARPPLPDEAEQLDIEGGVSLLCLRKISYDTTGRVVEVADVVMPGDRSELVYEIALKRWST